MTNTPRPVPVSYAGRDCIHVHGGLLYSGNHIPDEERFLEWAAQREEQAGPYVKDLGEMELRTVFHLVVRQDEEPRFEVHAEVQALLGRRPRHAP